MTIVRRNENMSILRKYRKQVKNSNLRFEAEMYNNVLGSLVITHYILNKLDGNELDVGAIKAKWKYIVKHGIDFWLDDPDFITKSLALFNMKPIFGRFAMCQSALNTLFMPMVDGQILPIREDGIYPLSAREGKIYPITEQKKGDKDETK